MLQNVLKDFSQHQIQSRDPLLFFNKDSKKKIKLGSLFCNKGLFSCVLDVSVTGNHLKT